MLRRTIAWEAGRILCITAEFGLHKCYEVVRITMQTAGHHANENTRHVMRIPISSVLQNVRQAQNAFDEESLRALAISIQHLGLRRPITVRAIAPCQYELVSGEKRLMACKQLGLSHVEAIIISTADQQASPLTLVENLQRDDLHYLQEAEGYASMLACTCMTQEALAARIGKSQTSIASKLRLLRLDAPVREALWHTDLSERHARMLLRLPDAALQLKAIEQMAKWKLTIKDSDALIAAMLHTPAAGFIKPEAQRENIAQMEQKEQKEPEEPLDKNEQSVQAALCGQRIAAETAQHLDVPVESSHASTRRVITKVRDHRLYVNAICDIVRQMQEAGIAVEIVMAEDEEALQIAVRVLRRKG